MPRWEYISDIDKFNQSYRIDPSTNCWVWQKGKSGAYGAIWLRESKCFEKAHRFSYEQFIGPIPEGLEVLHNCEPYPDNPLCVNPDHLWVGNQKDNVADMIAKGRNNTNHNGVFKSGSAHRNSIMTEEQVIEMRELYSTGYVTLGILAIYYGLKAQTVSDIVRRASWRHIK